MYEERFVFFSSFSNTVILLVGCRVRWRVSWGTAGQLAVVDLLGNY